MKQLVVATDPRYLVQFEQALAGRYNAVYVFDDDSARGAAATAIDGIIANVIFGDGAVFQFISFIRAKFPNMPVIAVNPLVEGMLVDVAATKAFEIATKSVGAWDYIDFNTLPENSMERGGDCLRQRIDAILDDEEKSKVARQDRRTLGGHTQSGSRKPY